MEKSKEFLNDNVQSAKMILVHPKYAIWCYQKNYLLLIHIPFKSKKEQQLLLSQLLEEQ